jgi:hypothetical protein
VAVIAQAIKDLAKDIKDNKFIDINNIVDLEAERGSEFLKGIIIINIAIRIKGERTRL